MSDLRLHFVRHGESLANEADKAGRVRPADWDGLSASFNAPSLFSSRRLIELQFAALEDLGGHDDLFRIVCGKAEEMRLEGEARKKRAGLLSAFDLLPCVREADAMLERERRELAPTA